MNHYDTAWRRLYDMPVMFEHLLVGYFGPAAELLDLRDTRMLSPQSVDDEHRRREGDMVWRVPYADESKRSLVVLLEFQAASDKDMPARMLRYEAAAVERLIAQGATDADGRVRTLTVVVHTGGGNWTAGGGARPQDVEVDPSGEVRLPSQCRYAVVDATRRVGDDGLKRNLAVALAELNAASSPASVDATMRAMAGWLREALAASSVGGSPEDVMKRFLGWLAVVMPKMFPKEADEAAEMVAALTQDLILRGGRMTLLAERAREWEQQWLRQGIETGVEQGLDRERELLVQLAKRKFGGGTAEVLATRLANIDDFARLEEIGGWIIDCGTGAELLREWH